MTRARILVAAPALAQPEPVVRGGRELRAVVVGVALVLALGASGAAQTYPASVTRVIDGDTVVATVTVWPGLTWTGSIRLDGIDTPELRGRCPEERSAARAAREALVAQLDGWTVTVQDPTHGLYAGRVVATVWADGADVGQTLIAAGHARPYAGGTREGWCP